jgi:hypothetical protein
MASAGGNLGATAGGNADSCAHRTVLVAITANESRFLHTQGKSPRTARALAPLPHGRTLVRFVVHTVTCRACAVHDNVSGQREHAVADVLMASPSVRDDICSRRRISNPLPAKVAMYLGTGIAHRTLHVINSSVVFIAIGWRISFIVS